MQVKDIQYTLNITRIHYNIKAIRQVEELELLTASTLLQWLMYMSR